MATTGKADPAASPLAQKQAWLWCGVMKKKREDEDPPDRPSKQPKKWDGLEELDDPEDTCPCDCAEETGSGGDTTMTNMPCHCGQCRGLTGDDMCRRYVTTREAILSLVMTNNVLCPQCREHSKERLFLDGEMNCRLRPGADILPTECE